jgi:16S rRNA (guanine527-N7)-methyltransferase
MYQEKIKIAFQNININLTEEQVLAYQTYYEMLIEWNQKINLTAITEFDDVLLKHFIDSVSLSQAMDLKKISSVIDVGTGGGFPGIPLKILYPHLRVTLLDSLNKRIQFLKAVIEKLQLSDMETIHGRAEDWGHDAGYREQYDLCVSRAVANLATLSEYCVPFIRVGGMFAAYKSGEVEEEVEKAEHAVRALHCEKAVIEKFVLAGTEMTRSFVKIQKKGKLDKKYPRRAGVPGKEPL